MLLLENFTNMKYGTYRGYFKNDLSNPSSNKNQTNRKYLKNYNLTQKNCTKKLYLIKF